MTYERNAILAGIATSLTSLSSPSFLLSFASHIYTSSSSVKNIEKSPCRNLLDRLCKCLYEQEYILYGHQIACLHEVLFLIPFPNCPLLPHPHGNTVPSLISARQCASPQATCITLFCASACKTLVGLSTHISLLTTGSCSRSMPSCPPSPSPCPTHTRVPHWSPPDCDRPLPRSWPHRVS